MDISTGTTITPRVNGGQNSQTYWVSGRNLSPIAREKSIQSLSPNYLHSASIIVKNSTEVLPYKKHFIQEIPRSGSLLRVKLPGLSPTCKAMELTLSSVSTIQIQKQYFTSQMTREHLKTGKYPSGSKPLQIQGLGGEKVNDYYPTREWWSEFLDILGQWQKPFPHSKRKVHSVPKS